MPKIFDKNEVLQRLNEYIDAAADPRLTKFCTTPGNPCFETLNEWQKVDKRFSESIKKAIHKQEDFLLNGESKYNPILAIFRLKQPQHGYTDKQTIDMAVNDIQFIAPKRPDSK